ncbi:MAG: hypothetical protein Q4C67_04580, partial [Deinococcus sp.]|nr:hypothetical protein [Deinococcus sp.]
APASTQAPASSRTEKGQRGFDLDLHVTFRTPLLREEALAALLALEGLTVDLYAPLATPDEVPSARLTGPLPELQALHAALRGWLAGPVRVVEVGRRGFLRSAEGYTEWMPWRRNVVLPRERVGEVVLREGEKYILE